MFLECSSKMSYFGLKSQIFLKNGESGIKYFKLKGRQKKSGGPHAARGPHFGHVCSIWIEQEGSL
jgi:hypothetical protein